MNVGIIGQGFVGSAIRNGLENFHNINTYDLKQELSMASCVEDVVDSSEVIFVCLPTPMRTSGECDTRILEEAVKNIDRISSIVSKKKKTVVIKSTVPPGTTDKINSLCDNINVAFSPEFLTEANSFEDFKNQNRIIIGGDGAKKVKQMFRKPFPNIPIVVTKAKTAEMVKYFINCFLATKVIFANQMFDICESTGIDYDKVCEYALLDNRIGKSHLAVPGPDGDKGYGGHCFPKDMSAMVYYAMINSVDPALLESVVKINNEHRTNKDWLAMPGRAVSID